MSKAPIRVLITQDCSSEATAVLSSRIGAEVVCAETPQPSAEELKGVHALLIRSRTKVNKDLLALATDLKIVASATSGFDHMDTLACQAKGITVVHCPEANQESAAQLTMTLMLDITRQMTFAHNNIKQGKWREGLARGIELTGLQLGIVGLGLIGGRVAELANAFKMKVVAYDPYQTDEQFVKVGARRIGMMELFKSSDIISLHVPLTRETKHLINPRTLAHFNPDAYLINVSRGPVIDETELAVFMRKGRLKGAALDVFDKEPLSKDSPLHSLDNIIFSPHIGGHALQAFEKASMLAATKICEYFQGQAPDRQLPLNVEWAQYLED